MWRVGLQFISHYNDRYSYLDSVRIALEGGCKWIQLRMKNVSDDEFVETAKVVRQLCNDYDARFVIDDRIGLVGTVGADGVHLGKNDMPVDEARKMLGDGYIIGGTANTIDDVERIYKAGGDYVGCGPFRFTTTKEKLSPMLGLDGYRHITDEMQKRGIFIPIVAIGGIRYDDIDDIMGTGVTGIALSGTVLNASEPVEEMKRIVNKIYRE